MKCKNCLQRHKEYIEDFEELTEINTKYTLNNDFWFMDENEAEEELKDILIKYIEKYDLEYPDNPNSEWYIADMYQTIRKHLIKEIIDF